jgi:DNA-binding response OmpR family regulator
MHIEHPQNPTTGHAILIVDDDPDIRSLIRTFLEHEGYLVYTSGDADRAAQIFQRIGSIDLLITDYSMPDRNGVDLAHELLSIRPDLPVLVISGLLMDVDEMNQIESGGLKFLPKPFSLPRLLSEVHNILHRDHHEASATLTA